MDLASYQQSLGKAGFGKRLPGAVYVLRGEGATFREPLDGLVERLVARYQISETFNLIKFRTDELKVPFLSYPDFLTDAHPPLRHAITIDLVTGKARHTDYADNINPPILHRKESFVPADHPRRAEFEALTKAEEEAGLYKEATTIGFKLNWEKLLAKKGLRTEGHTLKAERELEPQMNAEANRCLTEGNEGNGGVVIQRHKTALTRYDLSKPVKSLLEYGLLRSGATFFDYGCGQGADFRGLQGLGYEADGWDPVFRREAGKREADMVNLGYVLNVIEDPAERLEALVDAYRQAKRVLVVSALVVSTGGPMWRSGGRRPRPRPGRRSGGRCRCGGRSGIASPGGPGRGADSQGGRFR
jgi:hypothetical protein